MAPKDKSIAIRMKIPKVWNFFLVRSCGSDSQMGKLTYKTISICSFGNDETRAYKDKALFRDRN